ncbi:MAG: hypothetical protein GEU90_03420 [Gemmatimonas sp.]|nr:hypothetical protein [Gemmatimonas sp.]
MLLPFFEWCENTAIGETIRNSLWLFPVIEAVHLLALCLLGGSLLVVDLRMLGVGLKGQRISQVAGYARPFLIGSIVTLVCTGLLLFLSEAVKCYYNTSFWVKITTLPIALLLTFAVRDRFSLRKSFETSAMSRLLGAGSLTLWFVVAAAGRWIGFS